MESPRPPCLDCVRKHLAQAIVLLQESVQGYPDHRWLAVGHLAEAEAESQGASEEMADLLRDIRKRMEEEPEWIPSLLPLIKMISSKDGIQASCGINKENVMSEREERIASKIAGGMAEFSVHTDRVYGDGPGIQNDTKIISLKIHGRQVVVSAEVPLGDEVYSDCFDACKKIIKKASR